MVDNHQVLITTSTFGEFDKAPLKRLEEAGYHYVLNPYKRTLKDGELLKLVGDSVGIIAGTESMDSKVLESIPKVKIISRCGVGTDNIDLEMAKRLSIAVAKTSGCVSLAVAELTVGLILSLLRNTHIMDRHLRAGTWKKVMGNLLNGKKVGIIGFGQIGEKVAEFLTPFGMEIGFYDVAPRTSAIAQAFALNELLSRSDIVSLHVSKEKGSPYVLDEAEFQMIKKGAWLVNTSRGGVINEKALYEALRSGILSGAALDVFEDEPYEGPLKDLDNVLLTPHIGSYARETRIQMEMEAVMNLINSLGGKS